MPLCVAAGGLVVALALEGFTLAWTHSIEKIRWEEDYRIEGSSLRLVEARVRGHGAGMEPPPGSVLRDGVWHYVPALPPLPALRLTHSHYAAGYELCDRARCVPLVRFAPRAGDGDVIELTACGRGPGIPAAVPLAPRSGGLSDPGRGSPAAARRGARRRRAGAARR
jgi:hypothetical protein